MVELSNHHLLTVSPLAFHIRHPWAWSRVLGLLTRCPYSILQNPLASVVTHCRVPSKEMPQTCNAPAHMCHIMLTAHPVKLSVPTRHRQGTWQWDPSHGPLLSGASCKTIQQKPNLNTTLKKRSAKLCAEPDPVHMRDSTAGRCRLCDGQLDSPVRIFRSGFLD